MNYSVVRYNAADSVLFGWMFANGFSLLSSVCFSFSLRIVAHSFALNPNLKTLEVKVKPFSIRSIGALCD